MVLLKRYLILVMFAASLVLSPLGTAGAHELWVNIPQGTPELFRADLAYSHDFPNAEPIAEDRIHIFEPLVLVTPDGKVTLDQVGENYAYQKKMNLKKGSYLVLAFYRPTFWSQSPDGWAMKDRFQLPDAFYVEEAVMCGKTIANIGGAADDTLIAKPVGQRLEIVPLVNPAKIKVGDKMPLQVFCDGKPAKNLRLEGSFAGFSDKEYSAFSGLTDKEGRIDFIPLKKGYWILKARQVLEYPDKKRADETVLVSTLTFSIDH